jgi:thiamine-phosphate pyrophosphorylase
MSTQRWPREWLMSDERMGDLLWHAMARLPRGSGVVFRHHSLPPADRLELGQRVADAARKAGVMLAVARDEELALRLGTALVHNPERAGKLPFSRSIHDEAEALAALSDGAALVFVSHVFPTRSHPGAPALGPAKAAELAKLAGCPAIALGGMDEERFRELANPFVGYAGIDCWFDLERPSRE